MTLIGVSIGLWSWSQPNNGRFMFAERDVKLMTVQAKNEGEIRLIRSSLLHSALQPGKHQNDLLFLWQSHKPLNVSYFGQRSVFPRLSPSRDSNGLELCTSKPIMTRTHMERLCTQQKQTRARIIRVMFWPLRYFLISGNYLISPRACVFVGVCMWKVALKEEKWAHKTEEEGDGEEEVYVRKQTGKALD